MRDNDADPRALWSYRGQRRPPFAIPPGPGQESVWDYPRPPVPVRDSRRVEVRCGALLVAESARTQRVLETASPPTFYFPREDVRMELLVPSRTRTYCEWKGEASYFDLLAGEQRVADAAWSYIKPMGQFEVIAGWLSFYPERLGCFVDGERVRAQGGGYYGGWVTAEIVGPFKGEAGTSGW
jgi:uncharacterized protein (DUF427 family)